MAKEFTYNQIAHLNAYLHEQRIPYRLHFHNPQIAVIEPLGHCASSGKDELLRKKITDFFKEENLEVDFSKDNETITPALNTLYVAVAIIRGEGENEHKILAAQRGKGDFIGGWEFPGGKIEPGELPEGTLIRELQEELCVKVCVEERIDTIEYIYPEFNLIMDCYFCTIESGEPVLTEHLALRWLDKDTIDSLNWLPADVELVQTIKRILWEDTDRCVG